MRTSRQISSPNPVAKTLAAAIRVPRLISRGRASAESGFVLPAALIVLLVITLLTGVAVTVAVQSSAGTSRDESVKSELAAAEAGLQVATYRMSQLKPETTKCINEKEAVTTKCEDSRESIGNNATFQYWTSLPLKEKETCGGREVEKEKVSEEVRRCATSEGRVNGVEPGVRLQALVVSLPGEPLFILHGIVGLSEVKVSGSVKVPAIVASNEKIIGEGSAAFERGFELCAPKGSFTPKAGSERNASGVTVGGVKEDAALEKERAKSECPLKAKLPPNHATEKNNEDSLIGTTDKFGGNEKYSWEKYELKMEGTTTLTLGSSGVTSKFYFCSVKLPKGSAQLKIAAGAKVEIFIDSSEDPAGKCKGVGEFKIAGGDSLLNETKNPADLLIELYGKSLFTYENGTSVNLEASVYSPEGEVLINGGTKFKGGIVGNKVHLENGAELVEWSEEVQQLTNGIPTPYIRKVWEQCTPGTGAKEGC